MSADIPGIQSDLQAAKMHGWLFYDFRGRDPIQAVGRSGTGAVARKSSLMRAA